MVTLLFDSNTNTWNFTKRLSENSNGYLLPLESDNIACWHLESLTDLKSSIALSYMRSRNPPSALYDGCTGRHITAATGLQSSNTSLLITGDVTIEAVIYRLQENSNSSTAIPDVSRSVIAEWLGASGSEAQSGNLIYRLSIEQYNKLGMSWEYDSGVDCALVGTQAPGVQSAAYVAAVRNGTVATVYLNGQAVGTSDLGSAPNGGDAATGRFVLGGSLEALSGVSPGFSAAMVIFSCAITNSARSSDYILNRYNSLFGS